MKQFNSTNRGDKQRRSKIGSQLPEEFYDYLDQRILDSEIESNFPSIITPRRTFSLLNQRTLSSKKNSPNEERSYMEVLNFTGTLPGKYDANDSDFLLRGEETAIIRLEKENGEFGFNIVGGIDQEYIPGDPGIFISRIRNDGSAFRDRRLKIGDRIISVDGVLLAGKTHDDAVQLLHSTKNSAVFIIEQNAESRVLNKPTELSGILSSDESTSQAKSVQKVYPQINLQACRQSLRHKSHQIIYLASDSANNDYASGKHMTTDEANKIKLTDDDRISEVLSVTTASPFSPVEDKTAKIIDERRKGSISMNSDGNHDNDGCDYEENNHVLTSNSILDDVPVTPKKSYKLLDPSNPSIFNEVIAVSAGIAALGVGIFLVYRFVKNRSSLEHAEKALIKSIHLAILISSDYYFLETVQNPYAMRTNINERSMAGGAVRDLLMGIQPSDIDFATNATPDEMKELFVREEIRMLNKNGEEHGTITCRIDDKENFEITTLRIDIVCDGRRAKIEFTTNWQLDANRRDLTDIAIFSFFGRLALDSEAHEKATLDAIISNGNGLKDISGERIWMELKKICVGRLGGAILTTMLKQCNLASLLGLPENADTTYFCNLHKRYYPKIEAMTLLSSLFTEMEQIEAFHKRCKLSYAEKTLAEFIMEHRKKVQTSREKVIELAKYIMADGGLINELNIWVTPVFPISGIDLMNNSVPPGSHVKQILDHLFKLWIESQWMMGKEELLKHINDIEWNNEKTRLGYKRKHNFDNR
ncbi:hypothetical protein DINM_000100 [Dirofilaria immitis]|nr:hypothetical protein [Dirofilaria immitis]